MEEFRQVLQISFVLGLIKAYSLLRLILLIFELLNIEEDAIRYILEDSFI
jgi:hypothetical protein